MIYDRNSISRKSRHVIHSAHDYKRKPTRYLGTQTFGSQRNNILIVHRWLLTEEESVTDVYCYIDDGCVWATIPQ